MQIYQSDIDAIKSITGLSYVRMSTDENGALCLLVREEGSHDLHQLPGDFLSWLRHTQKPRSAFIKASTLLSPAGAIGASELESIMWNPNFMSLLRRASDECRRLAARLAPQARARAPLSAPARS